MEWLNRLRGQVVGLDTSPLIYFVEENPIYVELVDTFFAALERNEFQMVTSTVTLAEVLIYPLRIRNVALAQQYRDILFNQDNLTTVSFSPAIAEQTAQLRATYNL